MPLKPIPNWGTQAFPPEDMQPSPAPQKMAIGVPTGPFVLPDFLVSFLGLQRPSDVPVAVVGSPYIDDNMRTIVKDLLAENADWQRLLILETDMVLEPDTLAKHARHQAPIVGSMYFQHEPPYWANCCLYREGELYHPSPEVIQRMLDNPGLFPVDVVGMGATSIRRDVFENWPEEQPIFTNAWDGHPIGHDIYFCLEARRQGYGIYIDTSIKPGHISRVKTTELTYRRHNLPHTLREVVYETAAT